ncbi:MAG: protein kinase, partial [Myxococcales bacterium]|nr:protein kinase [Myxococcales bacterium]
MDSPARGGPTRIGRYDIEDVLGQGGMGRVYLARDSVLGRRVALKVLRDDLGLPPETKRALLSRMQNEARAAAAISHPGIVTLHDMGEDDALGLYLVFEYVEGPTLRERIARGPLPLEEVAEIAERLGDALSVAHAAGVIHRDVKPENVILAKTGPKIADFGIARAPDSTLTQSQNVFGTPAYSAPEALRVGDFSDASDQFSFAATLYEAITGERAFRGEDALAVATSVTKDPPPPLSASLGDPRVLGRVEAVLARGLAKEPDRRYPSSAELGSALARIIREPPPPSLSSQIARTPGPPSSMTRTSTPPPAPAENLRAYAEAPVRPSLVMRQQTHRVQN